MICFGTKAAGQAQPGSDSVIRKKVTFSRSQGATKKVAGSTCSMKPRLASTWTLQRQDSHPHFVQLFYGSRWGMAGHSAQKGAANCSLDAQSDNHQPRARPCTCYIACTACPLLLCNQAMARRRTVPMDKTILEVAEQPSGICAVCTGISFPESIAEYWFNLSSAQLLFCNRP